MSFQRSHPVKSDLPALISVKPRILLRGLPSVKNRSRETLAPVSVVDFYSTYKVWAPMIAAVSRSVNWKLSRMKVTRAPDVKWAEGSWR